MPSLKDDKLVVFRADEDLEDDEQKKQIAWILFICMILVTSLLKDDKQVILPARSPPRCFLRSLPGFLRPPIGWSFLKLITRSWFS